MEKAKKQNTKFLKTKNNLPDYIKSLRIKIRALLLLGPRENAMVKIFIELVFCHKLIIFVYCKISLKFRAL